MSVEDRSEINKKDQLSRRDFVKGSLLLLLGAGAVKATERITNNNEDIYKYENFKDLVGREPQLYPGYYTYFQGKAKIKEGAKIYSKAIHWDKDFLQGEGRETKLGEVGKGQEFVVKNPIVITSEADNLVDENWHIQISAPVDREGNKVGEDKAVDYQATWIGFSIEGSNLDHDLVNEARNQPNGIVFIRLADSAPAIDFWALGEEETKHILPPESAFIQAKPLSIKENGEWDINSVASKQDRQSPWFGPGQTSDGEYVEFGIVTKEGR